MKPSIPLFLLICVALVPAATGQTSSDEFTIVVLPDTQHYSESYPHIFNSQTKWIAENRSRLNIRFVVGVGDIVNKGESTSQWQNADAAVRTLDSAKVPYVLALGNHDYMYSKPKYRDTKYYNRYFGPTRYSGYSWYRGSYPSGTNDNFYALFEVNGTKYLVLALETYPRQAALDWASSVITANADKKVIITTHAYVYKDNTWVGRCDYANAESMGVGADNDGDEMWSRFVSRHPNVFLVLSGHVHGVGRRTDLGAIGNRVNQVLADYQHEAYGGGGYLRILKVRPLANTIEVSTYSPYYNKWRTDAGNQFTLQMHGASGSSGQIAGTVRDTSCSPVAGATVSAGGVTTKTNTAGAYSVSLAAPSTYTAAASASGFARKELTLAVNPGMAAAGEFFLSSGTCPNTSVLPSVSICTPQFGDTVGSPVRIVAYGNSTSTVTSMRVYVDGSKVYATSGAKIDKAISMAEGSRRVTVQAVDSKNNVFKQTINITVGGDNSDALAACTLSTTNQTLTICSPADGGTVSGPVQVVAHATDTAGVRYMQIYVNGLKAYEVLGTKSLDTALSLPAGTHRITVQAGNSVGAVYKKTVYVEVTNTSTSSCTISTTNQTVTICSPTDGATVPGAVGLLAYATDSSDVRHMQVYVDGSKTYEALGTKQLKTSLGLGAGTHRLTVQAGNSAGSVYKKTIHVTVNP